MIVLQAGKDLYGRLLKIYTDREAAQISDMVMEHITGFTKTQRLINKELLFTKLQEQQLQIYTEQLMRHKPVQYVLQEAWFAGMKMYVDEHVLIPRPETEELIAAIISELPNKKYTILDVGTGSGCIAIAIKKKLPAANVYALDINLKALDIAKKNAAENSVDIHFFKTDILHFSAEKTLHEFDVIVSNPPYIKKNEADKMLPNVLLYEPHTALFVPDNDPLLFYRAIADFSLKHLKVNMGKLYFEINETMGKQIAVLLKEKGFSNIIIQKDLQKKDRIVSAVLNKMDIK